MTESPIFSPEFNDYKASSVYKQLGFVKIKCLEKNQIDTLNTTFNSLHPVPPHGFFSTALATPAMRREAHNHILAVLNPCLEQVLRNFRVVLCSYAGRSPGSGKDDLPIHQDWSFVDETVARSMSVWIPLQDVSAENGCLQVVPSSQLHKQPGRAIGSGFRYQSIEKELRANNLQNLVLKRGEAVFFDHRLIHASASNKSTIYRLAIGAVLLPVSIPLHLGVRNKEGLVVFSDYDDEFILDADLKAYARVKNLL